MNVSAYIQSGVIESYVLGLATPEERAEVDQFRALYPEVEAAIQQCEENLETYCFDHAKELPESDLWGDLKRRLAEGLEGDGIESSGPVPAVPMPERNFTRSTFSWAGVAAAAAILLLVSIAGNILLYQRYHRLKDDYALAARRNDLLLAGNAAIRDTLSLVYSQVRSVALPGTRKILLNGVPGKEGEVTVYWNNNNRDVFVFTQHLPPAPKGKQYQLWALVDGKPVDAGMLENCPGYCRLKPVERADAFAITLEKEGGSPTPDLTQLYVMGKVAG
ncbi:anti-sigma factor [Chitinophaga rhizosphaerae]|uniref:anti-sigma factor n=1 Tax=Chitinophaga rhizosphaerae TaxID=1864947 RepID=UPI0013E0758C|nr:anti-sigma factor [Chitinophaga rhizosphaerae]